MNGFITCVGVAGVAVAVAVARLAGAKGSQVRAGTAVSQGALLTVLPLVALRAGALLHPAGGDARPTPGRHQGHVVQVAGVWRETRVQSADRTELCVVVVRCAVCCVCVASYSFRCRCHGS